MEVLRASPAKYSGPTLDAKATDIAIEELVLAYERLELE
jgi:phage tail-like protein